MRSAVVGACQQLSRESERRTGRRFAASQQKARGRIEASSCRVERYSRLNSVVAHGHQSCRPRAQRSIMSCRRRSGESRPSPQSSVALARCEMSRLAPPGRTSRAGGRAHGTIMPGSAGGFNNDVSHAGAGFAVTSQPSVEASLFTRLAKSPVHSGASSTPVRVRAVGWRTARQQAR